jgi:uncharacterized LabA/DUF88 family protein
MGISPSGRTPHYSKVMAFIDGSNLLRELSKEIGIDFRADKPPIPAIKIAYFLLQKLFHGSEKIFIRKYWFASYQGSEKDQILYSKALRQIKFEPVLFKKHKGKEKGVDIALATEMLVNSFNQNYDIGILIAGDKDYVDLVKEVKRYGPIINGAFFKRGLSNDLALAVDNFDDLLEIQSKGFDEDPLKTNISELRTILKIKN